MLTKRLLGSASIVGLVAVLLLCFMLPSTSVHAQEPVKPNVVLIITDDQGYGDIKAHGNAMIRTPNLDRLHGQSVRLTNFHVDPTCSPTRSALLTGRYSTRTGVWHTIMGRSILYREEVTLADVLAKAGYKTAMFGKWHLGDNYPARPQDKGFQEVLIHGGGGIGQTPDYWGNTYFDDTYFHNGTPRKFKGYCTDVFFTQAIRFMESNKDHPFFIYLPTNVPHGPFHVADKYSRYYESKGVPKTMAKFYGMIENFDENLGRFMARLKALGEEANTIFIFMTDNGTAAGTARKEPAGKPASWTGFNAGMRGQKGSEYEGGHRVPFFIRWPKGNLNHGHDVSTLTAHIDVLPTLAELCQFPLPEGRSLDGRSLVPLLRNSAVDWPNRTLVVHSQRIEYPEKWRKSAVMTDQWRLVNGKELYQIQSDPGQKKNLASAHPDTVQELTRAYEDWWASLKPSFDKHAWIVIGSDHENPARITCHDWHSSRVPWNQGMIRSLPKANGYWMIKVDRDGDYLFTLRHQPASAPIKLQATQARVQVGAATATMAVESGKSSVTIPITLKAGQYRMQTWLDDAPTGESRGAFFVEVTHK